MNANDFLSGYIDSGLTNKGYKPDILTCLANLSNDEVFTPPSLANEVLDLLPQSLFESPDTKFLDPVCKSGVFLREIARRLMKGLEFAIPNEQERRNHIFTKQLFGMAITSLTAQMTRRSLYCSKTANGKYSVCTTFTNESGNVRFVPIRHTFKNRSCTHCGASEKEYGEKVRANLESHAYEFIHLTEKQEKELKNMKFDVIIGNPPYQLSDGGNSASAKPIYQLFVQQAKKLNPRFLSMIIPSRWYAGGKGLDEFRGAMLKDTSLRNLVDYPNTSDVFQGVEIAGGVCYFLWDRDYRGKCMYKNVIGETKTEMLRDLGEFEVFVRNNIGLEIIKKIKAIDNKSLEIFPRNVFGFASTERGGKDRSYGDIKLMHSEGFGYVFENNVIKNKELLNLYKVIITYAMSGGNKPSINGSYQIVSSLKVLQPNEICTETYLVLGAFNNEEKAKNLCSYVATKTFRFLMLQALTSIHITRATFQFVPMQDFSQSWTDEKLYKKYELSQDEIDFIESMIRPMDNTTQNESATEVDDE